MLSIIQRLRKRKGGVLILGVVFILTTALMTGFIIDVTRLQLARIQLHAIVDSVALAASTNIEVHTLMAERYTSEANLFLLSSNRRTNGCLYHSATGRFHWNSVYPPSGQFDYIHPVGGYELLPSIENDCATIEDIVHVYASLHTPEAMRENFFGILRIPNHINPYQFKDFSVRIEEFWDHNDAPGGDVGVTVVGDARVDMLFVKMFRVDSVPISVRTTSTLSLL